MRYVLFYDSSPEGLAGAAQHGPAHRAWWQGFLDDGTLTLIGPFLPPTLGAMAVFTTREAAEAFAAGDPFVRHGVVATWRVQEWAEAVSGD